MEAASFEANNEERRSREVMKALMFLKLLLVTGIFLVLVLIGLNNRAPVDFNLPPLLAGVVRQPAALMYFGFFAVGLITGAVLCISIPSGKAPSKPGAKPA